MEAATITQETEQPMYQQGKYPSVVTTDDLVFELGKQMVGGLNKEKLLDTLLEKNKKTEKVLIEAGKAKFTAEKKVADLEALNSQHVENGQKMDIEIKKNKMIEDSLAETNKARANAEKEAVNLKFSNEKYVENNQRLDSELVKIRRELEDARKLQQESIRDHEVHSGAMEKEIVDLKFSNEKCIENNQKITAEILTVREKFEDMKNKKTQKSKTRKLSKKRS